MSAWVEESAVSEHGAGDAEESVDDLSECSSSGACRPQLLVEQDQQHASQDQPVGDEDLQAVPAHPAQQQPDHQVAHDT